MNVSAEMKIVLMAGEVTVAESKDIQLWQDILAVITGKSKALTSSSNQYDLGEQKENESSRGVPAAAGNGLVKLADIVGISKEAIEGACAPSSEYPYLHLDARNWEAFKKNTPNRGRGAISPIALSGTLLAIWAKYSNLTPPTPAQAQEVLRMIQATDTNPARNLNTCQWLQIRNGAIFINPNEMSKAIAVTKAFCMKEGVQ